MVRIGHFVEVDSGEIPVPVTGSNEDKPDTCANESHFSLTRKQTLFITLAIGALSLLG